MFRETLTPKSRRTSLQTLNPKSLKRVQGLQATRDTLPVRFSRGLVWGLGFGVSKH